MPCSQLPQLLTHLCLPIVAVLLLGACEKSEPPSDDTRLNGSPMPSAPWAAGSASVGPTSSKPVRYDLESGSRLTFRTSGKKQRLNGTVRVVRGHLAVDPEHLDLMTGSIEADIVSLRVDTPVDATPGRKTAAASADPPVVDRPVSGRARAWLGAGSHLARAVLAEKRWARFKVQEVEHVSATSAHDGRKKDVAPTPAPSSSGTGGPDPTPPALEVRTVTATLAGGLTLNGYRVQQRSRVRLTFEYVDDPAPGVKPQRVRVDSLGPMHIVLSDHDVEPRDGPAEVVARELKERRDLVGRTVAVDAHLVASPHR